MTFFRKLRHRHVPLKQAINDEVSHCLPSFSLPTNPKDIRPQQTEVSHLPSRDANTEIVQFFLYDLLCFKEHQLVQRWPQWILETVAYWDGTGADLRDLNDDFEALCPTSAGYAKLDSSFTKAVRPDGDCRRHIGSAVEKTIRRLKSKEENEKRAHEDWARLKSGSSRRSYDLESMRAGFANSVVDHDSHSSTRPYAPPTHASNAISQQSSYHTAIPFHHASAPSTRRCFSLASRRTGSTAPSNALHRRPRAGSETLSNLAAPVSGASLSHNTFSTARTSPPGSIQNGEYVSMMNAYEANVPPLTRENLIQATDPTKAHVSNSSASAMWRRASTSQSGYKSTRMEASSEYHTAAGSITRSSTISGQRYRPRDPPQSIVAGRVASSSTRRGIQYPQTLHSENPGQHQVESNATLSHYSSATSLYYSCRESPSEGHPQSSTERSVQRSGYGSSQSTPESLLEPSSEWHDASDTVGNDHKVQPALQERCVQSFASRSRSVNTAAADTAAFAKAECIGFSYQTSEERHEVGLREVERIHGMVQNFRRDSHVPMGPSMRQLNPATGRPFPTLVETIQVTEALRGIR